MHNPDLAADYLRRAGSRLKALAVLMDEESWADVVRESQEVVEICLKALLRSARIEVPRIHDVSGVTMRSRRWPMPAWCTRWLSRRSPSAQSGRIPARRYSSSTAKKRARLSSQSWNPRRRALLWLKISSQVRSRVASA